MAGAWPVQITQRELATITPYARNPRQNDNAVEGVARSIKEFGFQQPIVVDSAGVIVIGHTRYKAAQWLGLVSVPVHVADDLSVEQITALRIADNSTGEAATWDMDLLPIELASLRNADYDIAETGLDPDLMAGLLDPKPATVTEDEVPEPPADPITKPGDLWQLGEHRLLCGDSTNAEHVKRLMAGEKADLCFTSPPYGQQREYTKESDCSDWGKLMSGVFGNVPMTAAGQVLVNLGMIHEAGEWVPYWDKWLEWMRSQGWRRFGLYVWDQGPGMPGDWSGRLAPSFEFVFHLNRQTVKPDKARPCKHAGEMSSGNGQRATDGKVKPRSSGASTIQTHAIHDSVVRVNRQGAAHDADGHPAPFPVGLPIRFMESWPGVVYEPFCGSGTTLIAAEQLSRKCYGMEISPAYCDVIVKRWENLTGRTAELIEQ